MFPFGKIYKLLLVILLFYTVKGNLLAFSPDRNYCLGGRNIANIYQRQKAFNAGPCSPVILVPGFLGTGLQVEIDCPVLLEYHPEIFEQCGWNTCDARNLSSAVKMPRKEYRLWVGDLLDKFSIIQTEDQRCLAQFFKFQDGKAKNYTQPKGLKITWVGNTPQTSSKSKCGAASVQNLLGGRASLVRSCTINGYKPMITMLQSMGYTSGINYQVIPYDFRKTVHYSQASHYIKNSIESMFTNTGKKLVLYGHSYGNLHLLKVLQDMGLKEKKQKIKNFISVGAPYLGSAKSIKEIVGGDPSYTRYLLSMQVGFNYHSQEAITISSRSILHFLPRFNLLEFQNQKWLTDTLANPPAWLPKSDNNFPLRNLLNLFHEPILKVQNHSFYSSKDSYFSLFDRITQKKRNHFLHLIEEGFNRSDSLFNLQKPDVNTTLIFSGSEPTELRYTYDSISIEPEFKLPSEVLMGGGDGTVSSISNVVAAIKWIYQKNEGGVKLLNYGGDNNTSNQYYETISTQCLQKGKSKCQHACFHQDPNILDYLREILLNGQRMGEGRVVDKNCENLKIKNHLL